MNFVGRNGKLEDMAKDSDNNNHYPFCMAAPLEQEPETLGEVSQWLAEWKWNGIRAQLNRCQGKTSIWSRHEEPIGEQFPELLEASSLLEEGTVLEGEILAWSEGEVLPLALLQERLHCHSVSEEALTQLPVAFMVVDILKLQRQDLRQKSLKERKKSLVQLLTPGALDAAPSCRGQLHPLLRVSPNLQFSSWEDLAELHTLSHALNVEGVILKGIDSHYDSAFGKSGWWIWKND